MAGGVDSSASDPTPPAAETLAEVPVATTAAIPRDAQAFAWAIEEIDAGIWPALALRSDGVPYVVYVQQGAGSFARRGAEGAVKSAVRSGTSWDVNTIVEGNVWSPLDMAMGPDDVARVSYYHDREGVSTDLAYAVQRGDQWETEAAFESGQSGLGYRIAVGPDGRPHMSASNPCAGNGIEYNVRDDSGNWAVERIDSGPQSWEDTTSMAIDPLGNPHVSYLDAQFNNLALASRSEAGWNVDIVDDESGSGMFSSLAIGETGRFHISYLQRTVTTTLTGVVKYATIGLDDSAWEIREVGTLQDLSFAWPGPRKFTSLVVDREGNPWIAYSDEKVLNLAVWDGRSWQTQTVVPAGYARLGQIVSLKLDSGGHPHLAYFEVTGEDPPTGMVKYAEGTPR